MIARVLGTIIALLVTLGLGACGDTGTDHNSQANTESEKAPSVSRMKNSEPAPASSEGPAEVAVALTLEGSPVEIARIFECVAMPGVGLGFSAFTEDYVGNGRAGVRVGGGFEDDRGQIVINTRDRKWATEAAPGTLDFKRTDTRTQDGHSFVTIVATGTAIADAEELPFTLTVTCAPAGQWSSQGAE